MPHRWKGLLDRLDSAAEELEAATNGLEGDKGVVSNLRKARKMASDLRTLVTEPMDPITAQKIKRHAANIETAVQAAIAAIERGDNLKE